MPHDFLYIAFVGDLRWFGLEIIRLTGQLGSLRVSSISLAPFRFNFVYSAVSTYAQTG